MSRRQYWICLAIVFLVEQLFIIAVSLGQYEYMIEGAYSSKQPDEAIVIASFAIAALAVVAASIVLYLRSRRLARPRYQVLVLIAAGFLANFGVPLVALSIQTVVLTLVLQRLLFYLWLIGVGAYGMLPDDERYSHAVSLTIRIKEES